MGFQRYCKKFARKHIDAPKIIDKEIQAETI